MNATLCEFPFIDKLLKSYLYTRKNR